MLRLILATLAGILVSGLVVGLVEALNMMLYPPPAGIDLHDPAQVVEMVAALPTTALVVVLIAWSVGSFSGGWVAARLAKHHQAIVAAIVGAFILAGVIYNVTVLPHPMWMSILGLLLPIPSALFGARLARTAAR